MKRKVCFAMAMLLLLLPLAIFAVQATQAPTTDWAVVNYLYDAEAQGAEQEGGVLSFAENARNCLRRYTTLSWDTQVLEVQVKPITHKEPVVTQDGKCRIEKAGEYSVQVKNITSGESIACVATMMPVVKMNGEYLAVNSQDAKFFRTSFNHVPTIVCTNVDEILLDRATYPVSGTDTKAFLEGREKPVFGEHTLKFESGNFAISTYIDVHVCLVKQDVDPESGKNCLLLEVGDFGEGFIVTLDDTKTLAPGTHRITELGQHKITATRINGNKSEKVSNASPPPQQLNLQILVLMKGEFNEKNEPLLTLDEPLKFDFSKWDAIFYVNGKEVPANECRAEHFGTNVITVYNKNGEQIQNVFLVKMAASEAGMEYSELVFEFSNSHLIYAIIMMVPAAAMIVAAIIFFLRRRRVV